MAATATASKAGKKLKRYRWICQAHTDGSVSGVGASEKISGKILAVKFGPRSGYTNVTSGCACALIDSDNFDWLAGIGSASVPNSGGLATSYKAPATAMTLVDKSLSPSITGAGSGTGITIDLFVEDLLP